jgi:hypothetical protein
LSDATPRDVLPWAALWGVLLLLGVSLLYPASAFGMHGVGSGLMLLGIAAVLPMGLSRLGGLAFVWSGFWVLSLMLSPVPTVGFAAAASTLLAAVVFAIARRCAAAQAEPGHLPPIAVAVAVLIILCGAEAAWGIVQVFGPASISGTFAASKAAILELPADDPMREGLLHAVSEGRAFGTLGAPNIFASLCIAGTMLGLGAAAASWGRSRAAAVLAAAVALMCVIATLLSGSRGGLLALAGAALLFGGLAAARRFNSAPLPRLLAIAGAMALVAAVAVVALLAWSTAASDRWLGKTGMTQRALYYRTAWDMAAESPIIGRGAGAFEVLYPQFRQAGSNETRHAHSWIFDALATGGALGFVIVSAFVFCIAVASVRRLEEERRGDPEPYFLRAGCAAAAAGLLAHGAIEYSLSFREVLLAAALLAGFASGSTKERELSPRMRLAARVLALAAIVCFYFLEVAPQRAAMLRDAARAVAEDGDAAEARDLAERAVAAAPRDPLGYELRAWLRQGAGDPAALDDLRIAAKLNPHSARLRERIALVLMRQGRGEEALAEQREAIARHPLDANHRIVLAELLLALGRRDEAIAALESTRALKLPRSDEQVRRAALAERLGLRF